MPMRKQIFFPVFVLFTLVVSGCLRHSTTLQLPPLEEPKIIEGDWILEIQERERGYTGGYTDRSTPFLLFKLYESGEVEYDDKFLRKTFRLSNIEKKEVTEILEKTDFQNAKKQYKPLKIAIDSVTDTIIRFKNKNGLLKSIEIMNLDINDPKAQAFYPASLRLLIKRITELRP